MSSSRDPDRPDKMHSGKEKAVRPDPRVVASEIREKEKMALVLCLLEHRGRSGAVSGWAGKAVQDELARASTWADAGSGDKWGEGAWHSDELSPPEAGTKASHGPETHSRAWQRPPALQRKGEQVPLTLVVLSGLLWGSFHMGVGGKLGGKC